MALAAYLCVLLLACVGFAPSHAFPEDWSALDVVHYLTTKYEHALEANDADAVMDLYDPEVVVMADGFPTFTGSTTMSKTLGWISKVGSVDYTIDEIAYLDKIGRLIIERKTSKVVGKDGTTMFDGKTLLIWKWNGSTFKIYLQMYNSNVQK